MAEKRQTRRRHDIRFGEILYIILNLIMCSIIKSLSCVHAFERHNILYTYIVIEHRVKWKFLGDRSFHKLWVYVLYIISIYYYYFYYNDTSKLNENEFTRKNKRVLCNFFFVFYSIFSFRIMCDEVNLETVKGEKKVWAL